MTIVITDDQRQQIADAYRLKDKPKRRNKSATSIRHRVNSVLDDIVAISSDRRSDFMSMNERATGITEHEWPLRPSFAAYLDHVVAHNKNKKIPTEATSRMVRDISGNDAVLMYCRLKLVKEYPDISIIVERICFKGETEKAVSCDMGISRRIVNKRKWIGLDYLKKWCEEEVKGNPHT